MATTFQQAKERFQHHNCPSLAGVCDCSFDFICSSCGHVIVTAGEEMPTHIGHDGLRVNCHLGGALRAELQLSLIHI